MLTPAQRRTAVINLIEHSRMVRVHGQQTEINPYKWQAVTVQMILQGEIMDVKINNAGYVVSVDSLTQRKPGPNHRVRVLRYNQEEIDYRLLGRLLQRSDELKKVFESFKNRIKFQS